MMEKWNYQDIMKFLENFHNFSVLYNTKHTDYINEVIKNSNFSKLFDKFILQKEYTNSE